jgi:hypothetical protein
MIDTVGKIDVAEIDAATAALRRLADAATLAEAALTSLAKVAHEGRIKIAVINGMTNVTIEPPKK